MAISPGANRSSTSIPIGTPTSSSIRRYSSSFSSRNQWQTQQPSSVSSASTSSTVPSSLQRERRPSASSNISYITPEEDKANLTDFMRMLELQGPLKSLSLRRQSSSSVGSTASGNSGTSVPRTSLSRFQILRESHAVLTDSMSASIHQNPATGQQVVKGSPVSGSVAAGSYSSGGSGGRGFSPSTPHTPAIPSRLSEGLTAERYHDAAVFEDDDEDESHRYGGEDDLDADSFHGDSKHASDKRPSIISSSSSRRGTGVAQSDRSGGSGGPADGSAPGDDDELLFTMSDMNSGVASLNATTAPPDQNTGSEAP